MEEKLPVKHAHIEPTTVCNLNCKSCVNKLLSKERRGYMGIEQLKHILKEIPTLNDISLIGLGEPLLAPTLLDMAEFIKSNGIVVRTVTNATLFNKIDLNRFLNVFDEIVISLDAVTKESFEYLRGGANFDLVIDNVNLLYNKKKSLAVSTAISLTTVLTKYNINEIKGIIDFGKSLEVNKIRFVYAADTIGIDCVTDKYKAQAEEINNMKIADESLESYASGFIKDYCKKDNINYSFSDSQAKAPSCWWPKRGVYITYDGYVTPCCLRMDPLLVNFGNIYTDSFSSIWYGENYNLFREQMSRGEIPNICKKCP
ncbi:radical SAM protein [Mahella australiensis]|uniref:Radical SAM domain protein n=1 Tax=Mahella australiensis (strain DSM 15567 / CIP 107919 / 50-1 BON) TaxID=697281 RepID=F3ZYZ7_MAHA5|nr:radical SAM protein [Mahella australiensis]AEE96756.1 Radical SAM domain protein [Mahella australiensis 50-1 BON]